MLVRVTNITNRNGSAGEILHTGEKNGNVYVAAGRYIVIEIKNPKFLGEPYESWKNAGKISVHNADTEQIIYGPIAHGEITKAAVSQIETMNSENDLFEEDEFDFGDATEAIMPTTQSPGIMQGTEQISGARISLGSNKTENEAGGFSPIPGDRPKNVSNSDQFTVKAPRTN